MKAGLLVGVAPLLASYYGDIRVERVIQLFALGAAVAGFENIGQVEFRRELHFAKEFRYWVYRRILTFIVTLCAALWLRNYLALAIATPINGAVTVLLSYLMSSYRPRFAMRHLADLWKVSRWLTLLGIVRFFGHRGEAFILGRLTLAEVVGKYEISAGLSTVITQEFVGPAGRVLIPSYAKLARDPDRLRKAFAVSFGVLTSLSLATGVGASVLSGTLIPTLLGNQWQGAVPLFQWLVLHGAFLSIVDNLQPYFFVTKRERLISPLLRCVHSNSYSSGNFSLPHT